MKFPIPFPSSLRLHLMAWLVIPVLTILAVSAWLSYGGAWRQASLVTDRQLIASARVIAEDITYDNGGIDVSVSPAALELFASDSHDEVAYAVLGPNKRLIAGFPGLSAPSASSSESTYRTFETTFRTEHMRAVALTQPVVTPKNMATVTVIVGETQKARDEMVRSLWIRGFIEEAGLVLAGALSIWIGINRELRPLLRLRQAVIERPNDRFEPFDVEQVQTEIRPLVGALNSHMKRLESQILRQRRFLASAAHQLRTPLAVLKTQVGYARRAHDAQQSDEALRDIDQSLTAMSRLTNQLLTLGQVEHDRAALPAEIVDLCETARAVSAEMAPRALDAGIDLVFDGGTPCPIRATPALVRQMAANLVDNAIAYAGRGAVATVAVARQNGTSTLTVTDDGLGIEPEDRAVLFARFKRGRKAREGGSGLGLAIVAEIAEMLGGCVDVPDPPAGKGFCIRVRLPHAATGGTGPDRPEI